MTKEQQSAERRLALAELALHEEYQEAMREWQRTVGDAIKAKHTGAIERAKQHLANVMGEVTEKVG